MSTISFRISLNTSIEKYPWTYRLFHIFGTGVDFKRIEQRRARLKAWGLSKWELRKLSPPFLLPKGAFFYEPATGRASWSGSDFVCYWNPLLYCQGYTVRRSTFQISCARVDRRSSEGGMRMSTLKCILLKVSFKRARAPGSCGISKVNPQSMWT